jgi:remodeling and spacing factor 1
MNGGSSSSSDEHQPSEEEDEYNSDDYLPDSKQLDELNDADLLEEEDDEFVPRRSAKTVAKRRGQMEDEDLQTSSSACCICSKTDRPESLLLCDDCDDAYHLECLKPALLSVPEGDWYCPLCEHKRLCDNFIEKFIQLIKEHDELEVKRTQCMSKRSNRLANVMLNLDRMVKRSTKENGIVYSDEENEGEEEEEEEDKNKSDEDEDDDSVYGFKDDGSIENGDKSRRTTSTSPRRLGRKDGQYSDEPERLGVRSCRRKPQNYRFDDYDKKMKEAMIDAGVNGEDIEKESGEKIN